jgi:5'-3' exonuclease
LEPIKGIGFKTAYKLIEQYGDINSVLNVVASNSKYTVPKSWMKNYQMAYLTFLYQIVYDFEEEI